MIHIEIVQKMEGTSIKNLNNMYMKALSKRRRGCHSKTNKVRSVTLLTHTWDKNDWNLTMSSIYVEHKAGQRKGMESEIRKLLMRKTLTIIMISMSPDFQCRGGFIIRSLLLNPSMTLDSVLLGDALGNYFLVYHQADQGLGNGFHRRKLEKNRGIFVCECFCVGVCLPIIAWELDLVCWLHCNVVVRQKGWKNKY